VPLFTVQHKTSSERIYEGEIINLRVDTLQQGGKKVKREVVEHNGGVVILCQPQPDQCVLIKQYRYSVDEELIEFPAGRIEKGEEPLLAARRELTEETGYTAHEWQVLPPFYTAPGFCNEMLYLYRATNVELGPKNLDEDEETEVLLLPVVEAWGLVRAAKVRDAKTVAGICFLYAELVGQKNS
jgi:ADP-ribose pyrophosphatase